MYQDRSFVLALRDSLNPANGETHALGFVAIPKRLARLKNLVECYETGHLEALPRNLKGFAKLRNAAAHNDSKKIDAELF